MASTGDDRAGTQASAQLGLKNLFRSNFLPALSAMMRALCAGYSGFNEVAVFSVVLDANKINAEIRWRLGARQKPWALSFLFESIEAQVVIGFVPIQLETEILDHAAEIAADTGRSIEDVRREWASIRPLLKIHDPAMQTIDVIDLPDVKDLPYIATQQQLGLAAIYTDDTDLKRMGAPVIEGRIDKELRDYARGSAVSIGVHVGSGVVVTIAGKAIPALFRLLKSGANWFVRQPLPIQLTIASIVFVLACNRKIRAKFSQSWQQYGPAITELGMRLLDEYVESLSNAQSAAAKLAEAIPAPRKRWTILMHSRAACLAGQPPQTTTQIFHEIAAAGYRPKGAGSLGYLRSVLRGCAEFVEIGNDQWIQKAPADRFDYSRPDAYRVRR
jgi:hypothetical protein